MVAAALTCNCYAVLCNEKLALVRGLAFAFSSWEVTQ